MEFTKPDERNKVLNADEVAGLLGISPAAARRLFRLQKLPGSKPGKRWYTTWGALADCLGGKDRDDGR